MVYARMIQYADCLVDTSSQIFKENAIERSYRYKIIDTSKIGEFIKYVNIETNKPVIDKYIDVPYMEKLKIWDSTKIVVIDSIVSKQDLFKTLLQDAVNEALEKGGTNDEFEVKETVMLAGLGTKDKLILKNWKNWILM